VITQTDRTDEANEATPSAVEIARVAARLFAERGFDATSVREIVEASGVTKPTLYYHFGSKQGLGEAILTQPLATLAAKMAALLADDSQASDPVKLLELIFQIHFDFVVDDPHRSRFVYANCFGPAESGFRDEVTCHGETFTTSLLEVTGRLADAGIIDAHRVQSCAQVCRGLIMATTLDHIFLGQAITPGLAGRLVDDLLGGFGRPTDSGRRSPTRSEA